MYVKPKGKHPSLWLPVTVTKSLTETLTIALHTDKIPAHEKHGEYKFKSSMCEIEPTEWHHVTERTPDGPNASAPTKRPYKPRDRDGKDTGGQTPDDAAGQPPSAAPDKPQTDGTEEKEDTQTQSFDAEADAAKDACAETGNPEEKKLDVRSDAPPKNEHEKHIPPQPPKYLFRAIRNDENEKSVQPRSPSGTATASDHVEQTKAGESPYISLTECPQVALYYAKRYTSARPRVVRVEADKLDTALLTPLTTHSLCKAAGLTALAVQLTAVDKEWLVKGAIPHDALANPYPDPVMSDTTPMEVVWPANHNDKNGFLENLPPGTKQRCDAWTTPNPTDHSDQHADAKPADPELTATPERPPQREQPGSSQKRSPGPPALIAEWQCTRCETTNPATNRTCENCDAIAALQPMGTLAARPATQPSQNNVDTDIAPSQTPKTDIAKDDLVHGTTAVPVAQ